MEPIHAFTTSLLHLDTYTLILQTIGEDAMRLLPCRLFVQTEESACAIEALLRRLCAAQEQRIIAEQCAAF